MNKKIYFWLLLMAGFLFLTGCPKDIELKVKPKLKDISFSILNSYETEIDESVSNLNDKGEEQYSAYMNQRVLMIIEIDNPKNYVITSIVINDIEIVSFDSASTNSIIIYQVDTSSYGLKEFIISKINYKYNDETFGVDLHVKNKIYLDVYIDIKAEAVIKNSYITSTSISFDVIITNNNEYINQDEIDFIAILFDNDKVIQEVIIYEYDMRVNFPNLDSNKNYYYEIVATYAGVEFLLDEGFFQTFSQIYIDDITSTENSIHFYIFKNPNITISRVDIYNNQGFVSTLEDVQETVFTNLDKGTKYTILVSYVYNLDNRAIKYFYHFEYTTLASPIEVTDLSLNKDSITIGDSVYAYLTLNNPDNVALKAVVIAGVKVNVTNDQYISFAFVPKSLSGTLNVAVERFIYDINGFEVSQVNESYKIATLNVFHIGVLDIYNENDNVVFAGGNNDIIIELDNPKNYIIKEVYLKYDNLNFTYGEEEITILDQYHVKVAWKGRTKFSENNILQDVQLFLLKCAGRDGDYSPYYGNVYMNYNLKKDFVILDSTEGKEIYNIDQLFAIESGHRYKLMNDLDLAEFDWVPLTFNGLIDGNNHSINNLKVVSNYPLENNNVGMFKEFNGILKNLNLINANYVVRAKETNVGGLIGEGSFTLENCSFQGNIDIISENANVGGLVGKSENSNIFYNTANANIIIDGNNGLLNVCGGIVGYSLYTYINYNQANTNINAKKFKRYQAGGIAGYIYNNKQTISNNIVGDCLFNLVNEVNYSVLSAIGGIVGYSQSTDIYDNLILGTFNYTGYHFYYGGIVGIVYHAKVYDNLLGKKNISVINDKVQNNYIDLFAGEIAGATLSNNYITYDKNYLVYRSWNEYYLRKSNVNLVDDKKLNLNSFYIDELNWDEKRWDFETLDYLNCIYPILREKVK